LATIASGSASAGEGCGTATAWNFIGVPGSGEGIENPDSYLKDGPYGSTIQALLTRLEADRPTMFNNYVMPLDYPAIRVQWWDPKYYDTNYDTSVGEGYVNLMPLLNACPNFHFVLAGYSQGAHVAGNAFQDAKYPKNIMLVMFGDPRFNHKQRKVDAGDFGPFDGIYSPKQSPRKISGNTAGNVTSWCTGGDPVCNGYPPFIASCAVNVLLNQCPHTLYVERGLVDDAAQWVETQVP